jgi:hypothetical protein
MRGHDDEVVEPEVLRGAGRGRDVEGVPRLDQDDSNRCAVRFHSGIVTEVM